jgi:hypothetical protein
VQSRRTHAREADPVAAQRAPCLDKSMGKNGITTWRYTISESPLRQAPRLSAGWDTSCGMQSIQSVFLFLIRVLNQRCDPRMVVPLEKLHYFELPAIPGDEVNMSGRRIRRNYAFNEVHLKARESVGGAECHPGDLFLNRRFCRIFFTATCARVHRAGLTLSARRCADILHLPLRLLENPFVHLEVPRTSIAKRTYAQKSEGIPRRTSQNRQRGRSRQFLSSVVSSLPSLQAQRGEAAWQGLRLKRRGQKITTD